MSKGTKLTIHTSPVLSWKADGPKEASGKPADMGIPRRKLMVSLFLSFLIVFFKTFFSFFLSFLFLERGRWTGGGGGGVLKLDVYTVYAFHVCKLARLRNEQNNKYTSKQQQNTKQNNKKTKKNAKQNDQIYNYA